MKKWSVVAILAITQFVMVLDSTVMNVSISAVVKDLNTDVNSMQAAITFYTLTMAALMLLGAKIDSKIGLVKGFVIGSIIYGVGSFITAISPNIQTLIIGWSFIEAIGAILVIPAIAALVAVHYTGKDRVTAYAIIGGISGAAAAAGPLIGGFVTTYLSWRYVFLFETIIMIAVLIASRQLKATPAKPEKINILSAVMSATGMAMVVFGMLQSKTWGWIEPIVKPVINGQEIAPFGISLVAYLILGGIVILWIFINYQSDLEKEGKNPLLQVSMLKSGQLKAGLGVLMAQYMIIGAIFFVVPIYLQMVNGLDALSTGLKLMPLSIALIIFSIIGSRLVSKKSPYFIVRLGQILLVLGAVFLLVAVNRDLTGMPFALAMFLGGAGLGLLASQLGNINMSAVKESQSSEVGGLQGTFQNLGSSLGTALIGSILVASLTSGFITNVSSSDLPQSTKDYVSTSVKTVQIVPASDVEQQALSAGYSQEQANEISDIYKESQLNGLREALFFLVIIAVLSIFLSRNVPKKIIK